MGIGGAWECGREARAGGSEGRGEEGGGREGRGGAKEEGVLGKEGERWTFSMAICTRIGSWPVTARRKKPLWKMVSLIPDPCVPRAQRRVIRGREGEETGEESARE